MHLDFGEAGPEKLQSEVKVRLIEITASEFGMPAEHSPLQPNLKINQLTIYQG